MIQPLYARHCVWLLGHVQWILSVLPVTVTNVGAHHAAQYSLFASSP
ncbi:hypothetical protein KAZ93_01005 [Patescibacteria group bacterium]|nr:hypothetical protein [Patescibacteria group bacterium]